jgi:hypothetical protein
MGRNIMDCGAGGLVRQAYVGGLPAALAGWATTILAVSLSMLIDQTRKPRAHALRRARA